MGVLEPYRHNRIRLPFDNILLSQLQADNSTAVDIPVVKTAALAAFVHSTIGAHLALARRFVIFESSRTKKRTP